MSNVRARCLAFRYRYSFADTALPINKRQQGSTGLTGCLCRESWLPIEKLRLLYDGWCYAVADCHGSRAETSSGNQLEEISKLRSLKLQDGQTKDVTDGTCSSSRWTLLPLPFLNAGICSVLLVCTIRLMRLLLVCIPDVSKLEPGFRIHFCRVLYFENT